jgi:hypothetical protein
MVGIEAIKLDIGRHYNLTYTIPRNIIPKNPGFTYFFAHEKLLSKSRIITLLRWIIKSKAWLREILFLHI